MARAIVSSTMRQRPQYEPLYDVDPRTGASIEVFYADRVLAKSFGTQPGWYWWSCRPGCLPDDIPIGPFTTSYAAYRNIAVRWAMTLTSGEFYKEGQRRTAHNTDPKAPRWLHAERIVAPVSY